MSALQGVRVLDLSRYLPGPYCTLMLADYGAEVIRVEQPNEVIKKRHTFGQANLSDAELERLKAYETMSRNKRSLLLDLRSPSAGTVMRRLIEKVDVLVSDYRPGVLEASGLDYASVSKINPKLIYCAISLCGQTGPYRDVPGHDPVSLALAGVLSRCGSGSDGPRTVGVPISDINSALHAVTGILLALRARDSSGVGQLVDVAMSDTAFAFVTPALSRFLASGTEPPSGPGHMSTIYRKRASAVEDQSRRSQYDHFAVMVQQISRSANYIITFCLHPRVMCQRVVSIHSSRHAFNFFPFLSPTPIPTRFSSPPSIPPSILRFLSSSTFQSPLKWNLQR